MIPHTEIEAIHSRNGRTYWVDAGDKLYKQRLSVGQYQRANWLFAQQHIQKFRRCLDIGSNNACNAIHYAERFSHVECWEPTQLAQRLWHLTVRDNDVKNVTLHTQALAETVKTTEMVIHWKNGGHNHLENKDRRVWSGKRWRDRTSRPRQRQTQTVECVTLDSYHLEDVDFIKIDVEGYEWLVLQGAEQTIQAHKPIIQLEIVAGQCRKFGYWAEDMIDWLRARGYRCRSKKRGWLDGSFVSYRNQLQHEGVHQKGDMDLFFIPQDAHTQQLDPRLKLFG